MNRRRFLGLTVCTAGLAGCLQQSESEEDLFESEGTPFLSINDRSIDAEFSGTMRVVPSCRDEAVEIQITNGEPQDQSHIPDKNSERSVHSTSTLTMRRRNHSRSAVQSDVKLELRRTGLLTRFVRLYEASMPSIQHECYEPHLNLIERSLVTKHVLFRVVQN